MARFGPLLLLALLFSALPAAAAPSHELQRVRLALAHYDLAGGTIALLESIGRRLSDARGAEQHELRFLRAAVGVDLHLIATVRSDHTLDEQLAAAMGIAPAELHGWLSDELAAAGGSYATHAQALQRTLAHLDARDASTLAAVSGTQGEILRLLALRKALADGVEPAVALAGLAEDPCPRAADDCPQVLSGLDAEGRTTASALLYAVQAVDQLRHAADRGDPLAETLLPELGAAARELRAVVLRPVPRLPADVDLPVNARARALSPDLALIVGDDGVDYGYAARLRLRQDGTLERFAYGSPVLPELARLAYPSSLRSFMTPLDEVENLLAEARTSRPELEVAVGARGGTKAHLLGRVLLSLQSDARGSAFMLARDDAGFARALTVELASKRTSEESPEAPLRLRVRLGGYSLHLGGDYEDIPRVRDADGLRFDAETLRARLAQQKVERADLSFMADVPSDTLMSAMFGLADRSQDVRLVFP